MEGKDFWKVFRWEQRNGHQRQTLFLFWNVTNHGTLRVIANRLAAQFGWPYKVRWTRPLNILRILATTLNERSWEHARRTFHACIITLHSKTPSSLFEKRTHTSPQLPAGRFYRTEPTLLRLVCCYFLVIVGCCRLLLTDCDNFPRTLAATATPFFLHMGETKHVSATWCWPIWANENEENEEDEDDENRVRPLEESCGSSDEVFLGFDVPPRPNGCQFCVLLYNLWFFILTLPAPCTSH